MQAIPQPSPAPIRHVVSLGILMAAFLIGFLDGLRRGVEDAGHVERYVLPAVAAPLFPSR